MLLSQESFGAVAAIYDAAGVLQAKYAYDPWGNCTVISDMGGIGALNPIRYRGYYWDEEIALYYLNARYYDPEVGRFISQDYIGYAVLQFLEINGFNLYIFCFNNPINYKDPEGCIAIADDIIIFATIFFIIAVYYIETTFHPIQNIANLIGDNFNDLIDDSTIDNFNEDIEFGNIIDESVVEVDDGVFYYSEHDTNKNPSNREKHENGQARRRRDQRGEKGDKRRKIDRSGKRRKLNQKILHMIEFLFSNMIF